MEKIEVYSASFRNGLAIPPKYTCMGGNISPELSWKNLPVSAVTTAIICDDPDSASGCWVHWVIYNIPSKINVLREAYPNHETADGDGIIQGFNDFGKIGYGGPCPAVGRHRYFFRVYALDKYLSLSPAETTKETVLKAAEGFISGYGELMGTFKK